MAGKPELTDTQIDEAWNALLIGVPQGKHELLLQLKERYRTFLLSNNNPIHYARCMQQIKEEYGVEDNTPFFEKTYYSHLMGMRKPDPEIFEYVLQQHNLNPQHTVFIDDSPQHLRTAQQLGLKVELCTRERPLEVIVKELALI
ncbi:HAD-IA family hydrolase [Sphingobacterium sp. T2]|uniref:HAD-IA family hydrolase n=1 Tax=Sphingobacterium sp. T2 TaxID=1590596 RepID=UPI000B16DDE4|nr:HAD-IA family hydrolase [Sphingobacterium sp. T2]